jgi:hypothetical protein
MSEQMQRAAAMATIGLGASQLLTPRTAGKAFGLGDINDGTTLWLARLLGCANIALGTAGLNPASRSALRPQTLGLLGAEAAVTAAAGMRGTIPRRTAFAVLGFMGALVPGTLATD